MSDRTFPLATYRLQFTPDFGFNKVRVILPYLRKLGISHVYASPVLRARVGSTHGYDVCDPTTVNPELGTTAEFEELLESVAEMNMGWIQDIVPNHMAYSHENPYLVDVLENGPSSTYADVFDITWNHQYENLRDRVLAPFLGKPYGECVVGGELRIVFENGGLFAAYYDQRYPLSPESYQTMLGNAAEEGLAHLHEPGAEADRFSGLLASMKNAARAHRKARRNAVKAELANLYERSAELREFVDGRLAAFSTGSPGGNVRFDRLMRRQHFRLAFWKVSAQELNYRRFFTVSDLICVRVDLPEVFELTHRYILGLVERGLIGGLRIDHIDGLFEPATYLQRLRERAPRACIYVEKILARNEHLRAGWPVDGTTGYDFLNHLNYVFCDTKAQNRFDHLYERIVGEKTDPLELQLQKKRLIVGKHMAGDIDNLAHMACMIAGTDLMGRDISLYGLRRALVEVLIHFPVYRTYITYNSFTEQDARYIVSALNRSRETLPDFSFEFAFIERFLMLRGDLIVRNDFDDAWKQAVMRFQQFTGPLMAKSFEDTLFYVFNRHVALNEVGGWPMHFGIRRKEFHAFIVQRAAEHPFSMNASATHDTKRGEDTRARLQVLSEMPDEWSRNVLEWKRLNRRCATDHHGKIWPDSNDEYLLYQTLVGTFPLDGIITSDYAERIKSYMIKAVREAKVHTAWIKPDETYERIVTAFVDACLDPARSPLFTGSLRAFAHTTAWFGLINSLSQTVLKITVPGVPDFYQGTELLDFSLVDPDNRRPVDYSMREALLAKAADIHDATAAMIDGRIKLFAVSKCLAARRRQRRIFEFGDYSPFVAEGVHRRSVLAFARGYAGGCLLVIVPRLTCQLVQAKQFPLGRDVWQDTRLRIPRSMSGRLMTDIFSGELMTLGREIVVGDVLKSFPAAVLTDATGENRPR